MERRRIDIPFSVGNGSRFISGPAPGSFTREIHFRTGAVHYEAVRFTLVRITFGKITRAYAETRHHTFHYECNVRTFHATGLHFPYFLAAIEQVR